MTTLSIAAELDLRFFAEPTAERAALRIRPLRMSQHEMTDAGLVTPVAVHPYYEVTAAGHDWIEARDDTASKWVDLMVLGHPDEPLEKLTAALRTMLNLLLSDGCNNPGRMAAVLRRLDALHPAR